MAQFKMIFLNSFKNRLPFTAALMSSIILLISGSPPENEINRIYKGSIRFSSVAPMETIRGSSKKLKGLINATNRTFAFSLNNREITGFNSELQQEHFYENYIEADKYPVSTFSGKIIELIDFSKDGEYTVRAKGMLNIHGVTKERIIKSSIQIRKGILLVKAHFTIMLEDHDIKIPRIVFQRIAEEISIDVEAEYKLTEAVTQ